MMHKIKFPVAGTGYERRASVVRRHVRRGHQVRLVREPLNEYDGNAIAIWHVRYSKSGQNDLGEQIGYVPSDIAEILAEVMDNDLFAIESSVVLKAVTADEVESPRVMIEAVINGLPPGALGNRNEEIVDWTLITQSGPKPDEIQPGTRK